MAHITNESPLTNPKCLKKNRKKPRQVVEKRGDVRTRQGNAKLRRRERKKNKHLLQRYFNPGPCHQIFHSTEMVPLLAHDIPKPQRT
jgi:hypothetical protein